MFSEKNDILKAFTVIHKTKIIYFHQNDVVLFNFIIGTNRLIKVDMQKARGKKRNVYYSEK